MSRPVPSSDALPDPKTDPAGLRAFVAVARSGNVGRAAGALGLTQPSVSARIAGLERAWGTLVFRRLARGMALTPEGARLLPLAEAALRTLEALDAAAGLPVATMGEVRFGSGDALARELLPRVLAGMLETEPALGVRLVEGPGPQLLDALRDGDIDIALVVVQRDERASRGLQFAPLLASPVDVLFPPGRSPRGRAPVTLKELRDRRLVTLQEGSGFRRHVANAFAAGGLPFRPAVEVGNLSLVRRFVAAGAGYAPVPAVAFDRTGVGPEVDRRRLDGIAPVAYATATRAGVPLPDAAGRFLATLAREARRLRP